MIKGILFDVGGVVIRDSSPFVKQSVQQALKTDNAAIEAIWSKLIPLLGSGLIDEQTFWERAAKEYNVRPVTPQEDLFGKPFEQTLEPFRAVLAMLRDLGGQGIRRIALSNTIEAHAKVLRQAGIYDDFDDVLLSNEIGLRKPDAKVFKLVLDRTGLKPEELLLLDDREENLKAAQALGIRTLLAVDENQIVRDTQSILRSLLQS